MTQSVTTASVDGLRVGDLVEVRSAEEIVATLDERGELENLPFMPEMLKFCGQRLTVHKVAHKLCNTINNSGMHKLENAVHLTDSRCDGASHGGCQTACLLYWKEAWLKRVDRVAQVRRMPAASICRCWKSTHERSPGRTASRATPARPPNCCEPRRPAYGSSTSLNT